MAKYGQGLVAIRKIEAAQHIMEALRDSNNVTFLSGNALNMVNIPGAAMGGRWLLTTLIYQLTILS